MDALPPLPDFARQLLIVASTIFALLMSFLLIFKKNVLPRKRTEKPRPSSKIEDDAMYRKKSASGNELLQLHHNGLQNAKNHDSKLLAIEREADGPLKSDGEVKRIRSKKTSAERQWRCACEDGLFLPSGLLQPFAGAEAMFRLSTGQCYHKR